MTEQEVYARLSEVLCEVLDLDEVQLAPETTANEIEGWDSVTTVEIIVAVEEVFKIRFKTAEIASLDNVGQLVERIMAHAL